MSDNSFDRAAFDGSLKHLEAAYVELQKAALYMHNEEFKTIMGLIQQVGDLWELRQQQAQKEEV